MAEEWLRKPGESARQHAALERYLAMGPSRSLDRLCRSGKRTGRLAQWCLKWSWVRRAEAYDRMISDAIHAANLEAIVQMAKNHAEQALKLQEKALQRLAELNPKELSPADVLRYLAEAQRLERLARGEPESVTERRNGSDDVFERARRRVAEADATHEQGIPGSPVRRNGNLQSLHSHQAN
jgi:hypothetical protein